MKTVCHFHVIRFMPFIETGEFANIGVVMYSPQSGFFEYRIAPVNFARIRHFFKELDSDLYKAILLSIENEFEFIKSHATLTGSHIENIMHELTRPRDGMVLYSSKRSILTTDAEGALETEYGINVGRAFTSKIDFEQKMTTEIRKLLKPDIVGAKYTKQKLNTKYFEFDLPLVAQVANEVKAIKPLAFNQKNALAASDHANTWLGRAKKLIEAGTVQSSNLLFAMNPPAISNDALINVYGDTKRELELLDINCVDHNNKSKLLDFAKFDLTPDNFNLTS